jgi:hypothetical protein
MQWSCPHCGILLAVADDVIGTGWSFSRCYKCGGFALIRRAEVNIIKVDKAPPGERVILPEATAHPQKGMMNQTATQKMAKYSTSTPQAIVQSKIQKASSQTTTPPPFVSALQQAMTMDISKTQLPAPLPELTENSLKTKIIPAGIVFATLLIAVSGIYLVLEGQTLWFKAKESASRKTPPVTTTTAGVITPPSLISNDLSHDDATKHVTSQTDQKIIASAPLVITDQVKKSAMAPLLHEESPNNLPNPMTDIAANVSASRNIAQAHSLHESKLQLQNPAAAAATPLSVRISAQKATLYAGPGANYPIVGTAFPDGQYQVTDWNDRWFKLNLSRQTGNRKDHKAVGWIRNDLVQIISK